MKVPGGENLVGMDGGALTPADKHLPSKEPRIQRYLPWSQFVFLRCGTAYELDVPPDRLGSYLLR